MQTRRDGIFAIHNLLKENSRLSTSASRKLDKFHIYSYLGSFSTKESYNMLHVNGPQSGSRGLEPKLHLKVHGFAHGVYTLPQRQHGNHVRRVRVNHDVIVHRQTPILSGSRQCCVGNLDVGKMFIVKIRNTCMLKKPMTLACHESTGREGHRIEI